MLKKIKTPEQSPEQRIHESERRASIANRAFLAMSAKIEPMERQVADLTEELEISRAQNAGLIGYGRFHEKLIGACIKALGVQGVAEILPRIRKLTRAEKE